MRRLLIGWVRIAVDRAHAAEALDLCMRHALVYRPMCDMEGDGGISLEMSSATARRFQRYCAEEGIKILCVRRGGIPYALYRYRHRVGLPIGFMIGALILFGSSRLLWDIRISGNEEMTARQVRQELEESGLHVGMPLSALDVNEMELQIQLDSERISWVSINMAGTVAYVEIRERVPTPKKEPLHPANLVARCEGIIEEIEVYAGNTMIQSGQAVQKGELLVSGLYDSQALGWRVTRAAGRITARTEHTFLVEIPWKYEKKEYQGAPIIQKKLIFFEKEIKLFKNSSILGSSCDKISNIDTFTLGNGVSLPFSVLTERYLPYDYVIGERDPAQAEALAYYELERQITQCMPDAILLKKEITASLTEDAFVIKCKVRALENIAEVMEFSVDERRPLS